jgi:hypothetical protein
VPGDSSPAGAGRPSRARDRLQTENIESLNAALAGQPEIRPDVVARGQALAADPSYPGASVLSKVAAMILNAPDPSEDQA